jgi:hypothetical protein
MAPTEPSHKELTDEERGTIIEEVRTRNAIWDSTHKDHSKRIITNALFQQVADFMTKLDRKITGNFQKYYFKSNDFRQGCQRRVDQFEDLLQPMQEQTAKGHWLG